MRNLIFSLAIVLMAFASPVKSEPDSVYICTGKYSKAYHSTYHCKGLRNCKGERSKDITGRCYKNAQGTMWYL